MAPIPLERPKEFCVKETPEFPKRGFVVSHQTKV